MADGQDAQASAQPASQKVTPEQILRALGLWDDKKTAAQNVASAREEGLGGWLDKPKEYLDRLIPNFKYDNSKSLPENLENFRKEGTDSVVAAVGIVAPAVLAYLTVKHGTPYVMNPDTIVAAAQNPSVLVSGLSWVQKMRLNAAVAELASLPEGAALVENLRSTNLPHNLSMNPATAGGGAVSYRWQRLSTTLTNKPTDLSVSGFTTHGSLVSVLAHELRHLQQATSNEMSPFHGKIVTPGSSMVYNRFVEADAQATATDIAWKLKEMGKPDAWNDLHGGKWMEQVAKAYEELAVTDPAALTDGRAKRAAFDAWFTAETAEGVRVADVYNQQGLGSYPNPYLLETAAQNGAVFAGDLTAADYARAGGNGGDNYLTRTGGLALDDPFYQTAVMPPIGHAHLDQQQQVYTRLRDHFNEAAKQQEFDFGPKPASEAGGPAVIEVAPISPTAEKSPQQLPLFEEPAVPSGMSRVAALNNTVDGAMGAVGLVQGTLGVVRSVKEGDNLGVAVNGANAVTGGTALGVSIARGLGHEVAPALGSVINHANIVVTVGTGIYQVATEKGNFIDTEADGSHNLGNKSERTIAVVATTATGVGLTMAGVGSAGVVPAVVAVAVVGDKAIEARRAWKDVDRTIAENGEPQRRHAIITGDDGSPDVRKFKHIFSEMLEVSPDMKDSALPFVPKRDPKTGRIAFDDMRKLAIGEDPKVLAEFEHALNLHIARQQQIMKDNDSILPNWTRFDDGLSRYTNARMILSDLQAAKTELGWFKTDIAAWNGTQPGVTSRFAAPTVIGMAEPCTAEKTVTATARTTTTPRTPRG
jgi:hypothetical protein